MRKLMLSLAVMAVLSPVSGYSLGLGDLELNSALNQELNAEIKVLSASTEDAEQLIVKLAGREAFNRAGLDRPFILQQLKFKLIDKEGVPYVKIFTKAPIQEPFLSFLVEIDWPQGHLLREYTLLLDPPVFDDEETSAATSTSSNMGATTAKSVEPQAQTQSASVQSQTAQPTPIAADADQQTTTQNSAQVKNTTPSSGKYRVESNDTLWVIADKMRHDKTISVEQMMLALVRKNPNAFIRKNINGVKRGYILRTPTDEETVYFDREQAIAQAKEHTALWRKYRQNKMMANDTPASSMAVDEMDVATPEQPIKEESHLSIVSAGASDNGQTGAERNPNAEIERLKQDLSLAREQIESERLEKENLRERLADLEARVKRVIELKDGNLAELQQNLQGGAETTAELPAAETTAPKPDEPAAEQQTIENAETTADAAEDVATNTLEKTPESEDVFVDETTAGKPVESDVAVVDENTTTPAFAQKKNKNIFEQLMDDPKLMGVIVGALAFIIILIALLLRRMRGSKPNDEWSSVEEDAPLDLADIENAISQDDEDITVRRDDVDMESTIETSADMIAGTEDDEKTRLRISDDEDDDDKTVLRVDDDDSEDKRDDIIEEADVYLAYGIYQQAEELLNNAIVEHPERHDYRVKLLETYFASKDAEKFESLAGQLKTDKDNEMVDWDRVVAMGMDLCPDNALFTDDDDTIITGFSEEDETSSAATDEAAAELDGHEESTPDFDLGLDELGLSDLDETPDNAQAELNDEDLFAEELDLTDDLKELDNELPAKDEASTESASELGELDGMEDIDIGADTKSEAGELNLESDMDDDFSLDFDATDLGLEEPESDADQAGDVLEEIGEIDLSEDLIDESAEFDKGADPITDDVQNEKFEAFDVDELDLNEDHSDDATVLDLGGEAEEEPLLDDESIADFEANKVDAVDDEMAELEIDESDDLDAVGEDADRVAENNAAENNDGMEAEIESVVSEEIASDVAPIPEEAAAPEANDDFDISELSEDVDEVSTKLSLAKAYIDMGDVDGARSILEEVKQEGSEEQQEKADELLQQAG